MICRNCNMNIGAEYFYLRVISRIFWGENILVLNLKVFKNFVKSHAVKNSNASLVKILPQCDMQRLPAFLKKTMTG